MSDSLQMDTVPKKKDGLDAPVTYEANDSIVFTQDGYAHLYGDGKVNYPYQHIELTAEVITMNDAGPAGVQRRRDPLRDQYHPL